MLAGAIAGFATANETRITSLGLLAALAAGTVLSLLFAVISLTLQANQTATGLALTIFGRGFSHIGRRRLRGHPRSDAAKIHVPVLSDIPRPGLSCSGMTYWSIYPWPSWPSWRGTFATRTSD